MIIVPEFYVLGFIQSADEQGCSWNPVLSVKHFFARSQLANHVDVVSFLKEFQDARLKERLKESLMG